MTVICIILKLIKGIKGLLVKEVIYGIPEYIRLWAFGWNEIRIIHDESGLMVIIGMLVKLFNQWMKDSWKVCDEVRCCDVVMSSWNDVMLMHKFAIVLDVICTSSSSSYMHALLILTMYCAVCWEGICEQWPLPMDYMLLDMNRIGLEYHLMYQLIQTHQCISGSCCLCWIYKFEVTFRLCSHIFWKKSLLLHS